MKQKTRDYIRHFHMTAPGDGVVAGLSGGADSVCLLHLLWCLKEELDISLRAVHVHHGLRGDEADRDAAFCAEFCERLGVPFREVRIDAAAEARAQGISVEEAGRLARYRVLEEEAEAWEASAESPEGTSRVHSVRIAVAHHGDDNAETILHNLFRGSGLKGLGGIAPVRGRIIRPLLWAERSLVQTYLTENGIGWVEDSTNGENDYTRNRIRNDLIPTITEEINVQAVRNILRAGERISQADRYFERQADAWLEKHGKLERKREWDGFPAAGIPVGTEMPEYHLDAGPLDAQEEIIRGYIIRRSLEQMSCPLKDITARHIEDVAALAEKGTGKMVELPHGIRVEKEYGKIRIRRETGRESKRKELLYPLRMKVFPCENPAGFPKNQYTKWFDYDKIKDTLSVRTRQEGDYITLPGGGRKTVKTYMIDAKIPREERDRIILLAEGSHILWIVGHRISEYYKVTEHTKTVLEVHVDGGDNHGR